MSATDFSFAPLESAPLPIAAPSVRPGAVAAAAPAGDPAAEAAMVVAAAQAQADEIRAAAHAEGMAAGHAEALAALTPAAHALEQAAEAVGAHALAAAERLEGEAVDLALLLAAKIVGAAVEVQPELVVEAVRGALRGLVERERVTVLVSPDDLDLVREAMGGVVASLGGIEHCEVQAERRVAPGGAVVRTPEGDIDARVESKLERAREVVAAALGAS